MTSTQGQPGTPASGPMGSVSWAPRTLPRYGAANGQLTSVVATLDVSDPETARLLTCPPPGAAPVAPAPPATGTGEATPHEDDSLESLGLVLCLLAVAGGTFWVRARKAR